MRLSDIALRLARDTDAPALAVMSRDLIEIGLGWQYRTKQVAALLRDAETVTVVANDGPRTVGFAVLRVGDERAHLVLLAVGSTHRRRGIGARMTRWLIETAAAAGVASVHVELRAQNQAAYALYRSLEFTETQRVYGYYRGRETAIRMLRTLRAEGVERFIWSPPARDRR